MELMVKMNSPQSTIDPYFNCSLDSGPTPTVVTNFKLPNSTINKDGPFLQIVEQPQTKFRFRYKSEMVGTHGQLKAESSDRNKTVFPTVKLCNWNGGPALVRLTLYTAEENENDRKRHVHELSGKNCNREGYTGGCEVVVDEKNNYTAQFPNLGIIHIAKRDVQNIIFQRKKEQLVNYACMVKPELRNKDIQHNISPMDIKKLKEDADEEAKLMDLNKVVLRFQAFSFNTRANCYRPFTQHVDSDVIFNLKNASTGELKIVRISAVSGPVSGGSEIWMLVEKVKKSNVKVKFFEIDQDGFEIWKGYGDFKESDVHHQYAIIFKSPPYRYTNIQEPVQVKIQLERTTDNDTSDSVDFTYTPETLKRPSTFIKNEVDFDTKPLKKQKPSPSDAIDLNTGGQLFLVPSHQYSPEALYQQSSSQRVPSPITPADSPSSFYSPTHPNFANSPNSRLTLSEDDSSSSPLHDESYSTHNFGIQNNQETFMNNPYLLVNGDVVSGMMVNGQDGIGNPVTHPIMGQSSSPNYQKVPSPSQMQPSPYDQGIFSPCSNYGSCPPGPFISNSPSDNITTISTSETPQQQIQQFDNYLQDHRAVVFTRSQMNNFDLSGLNDTHQNSQNREMDLLDVITSSTLFDASNVIGDIQPDSISSKGQKKANPTKKEKSSEGKDNIDQLSKQLSSMAVSNKQVQTQTTDSSIPKQRGCEHLLERDIAFRVALKAADCLQLYAAYGDTSLLLAAHRYLLGVQNSQGDNSLHTAINNKNLEAFDKIIKAALDAHCADHLLNTQNLSGEAPLHLAMKAQEPIMIQQVLSSPACRVNILDLDGNTPLHVAAAHSNHICLSLLIQAPNVTPEILSKVINTHNFHGKTSLHLAVSSGCLKKVQILLRAGADVHACERKRGANSLHLAVMFQQLSIVKFLINNTNITVDARMFDGNTALHIAAQAGSKDICALLIKAKANPNAKNSIQKVAKREEDEEETDDGERVNLDNSDDGQNEEESEEEFYTPFDYAAQNEEILTVLRGETDPCKSEEETLPQEHRSKPTPNSSTIDSGIDITC